MTEQREGITVSGHGEVAGVPDQAAMSFGVSLIRSRVADAMADAAVAVDKLLEALAAAGVDSADLQTSAFSTTPEYDYSGNRRRMVG